MITSVAAFVALATAAPATLQVAQPGAQKEYIPMLTPKKGDEVAVLDTNQGTIVLAFLPEKAPGHVKNFKDLAGKGFYDGTRFHRVIPGFMIQGGDPFSKTDDRSRHGTGGPGYQIKAEFNDTPHLRGVLSMARAQDPDSAGSQFFICVKDSRFLDNQYTAFGCVVQGIEVADKIVALPRDERDNPRAENPATIKSVKIATWPLARE